MPNYRIRITTHHSKQFELWCESSKILEELWRIIQRCLLVPDILPGMSLRPTCARSSILPARSSYPRSYLTLVFTSVPLLHHPKFCFAFRNGKIVRDPKTYCKILKYKCLRECREGRKRHECLQERKVSVLIFSPFYKKSLHSRRLPARRK